MKQKILLTLILTILLSFTFATPALAQEPDGRIVFGGNLTLKPEEKIEGDVVVFGGNVTVPASSKIEGSLAMFGGNANIDGKIEGDIAMFGGNINLGETAVVEGDIGLAGGKATVADGATVEGSIAELNGDQGFTPPIPPIPPIPEIPEIPSPPQSEFSGWEGWGHDWDGTPNFFERIGRSIVLLLALAVVSWLVATFMPQQMKTVGDAVVDATVVSFGVGLLTAVIVATSFLLVFTICLAFIPIIAFLMAGVAALFGWIVIGQIIGERLLTATGRPFPNFILSTVVGVTVLTVVAKMPVLSWITCIGGVFWCISGLVTLVAGSIGLGAVILTRFGTRPYDPSSFSTPGNPSPPPPPRPRPGTWAEADLSDLDVAAASEAELKAKIKAALDEADAAEAPEAETPKEEPAKTEETPPEKPKRKKRTTKKKPTDATPPEPKEPTSDTPDNEEPDPDLNA